MYNNNLTGSIPESFLQLDRLVNFHADSHNCVPDTVAPSTTWLQRIPDRGIYPMLRSRPRLYS